MRCPTPAKHPYPSKRSARRAIAALFRNRAVSGPGRLHAYECPSRSHWHVGHLR